MTERLTLPALPQAARPPARSLPRLATLAAAALLSACSLIPTYERPAAPVAATYPGQAGSPAPAGQSAADIAWQRYFGDARLRQLIELALANNRDLRVAMLNIDRSRAQYRITRADQLPTVNGVFAGERIRGVSDTYTAGLAVTGYELDFFGRVRALGEAAQSQVLATEEARKTVQISLVAAVANSYLSLQADEELLRVTRQTLGTREESLKLNQLRFDNGVISALDYRQAESLYEAAKVALAQQTRQRAIDENALVALIGQPLPADLPAGLPLTEQRLLADLPAGVPSELLTRRPDLRQAELQLLAANANIGAARAAFFPRISLTGSAGSASSELSGLFKSGSFAWTFSPQLVLPIFDAGRNQANLDVARVDRDLAVAQYEKVIQTAFQEVSDALAGRATLDEQVRAQRAQAAAEQQRFELADLRYQNGASSYLDVLDAQRALFTAQQAVVQTQAQRAQNLVTLYKVLGGGWTEAAATTAAAPTAAAR